MENEINNKLIEKLIKDDETKSKQIELLMLKNQVMREALLDIADFKWIGWSSDYSPKSIAVEALRKIKG